MIDAKIIAKVVEARGQHGAEPGGVVDVSRGVSLHPRGGHEPIKTGQALGTVPEVRNLVTLDGDKVRRRREGDMIAIQNAAEEAEHGRRI